MNPGNPLPISAPNQMYENQHFLDNCRNYCNKCQDSVLHYIACYRYLKHGLLGGELVGVRIEEFSNK